MSENTFGAERSQDDPVEGLAPFGDETPGDYEIPEDYEPTEQVAGASPETGVLYTGTGEPETTPHDLVVAEAEEESL